MNFLTPAAFALAVLLPVIVAMYLLKLRRTEQTVSSVYLWQRMVRDVEANAPWQRLRRNLLMILQLIFLAVLIFVLAQPFIWTEGVSGQAAIFIIDNSASMGATDAVPNRLEAAKNQARQLADGLPDDTRVTVIAAGESPQVLASATLDRRQIHQAIERIQLTTGGGNLANALGLASAIASRQPDTDIVLLSDGRTEVPDRMALQGRLRYYPIGLSGNNQAISLLSLETGMAGSEATAFAQVTNFSDEPAQRRLELYADGRLVNAFDLQLPAGGIQAVIADDLPVETSLIEARLAGEDALPTDDRAWAVRRDVEPAAVTLVTGGNLFLQTALSLLPGLEITAVTPEQYEAGLGGTGGEPSSSSDSLKLTIFDGYVPVGETYPPGNLLFIAPYQSTPFFTVTGKLDNPSPRIVDPTDSVAEHLSLTQVNILDTARISLPPWGRTVIAGDTPTSSTPLLFLGQIEDRRAAVMAFDLRRSDLPLQVAFPLLMANLTGWLTPGHSSGLPDQTAPGSAVSLSLPPDVSTVTITKPDGSRTQAQTESGRVVFADTHQLGVYQVAWGDNSRMNFTVNLFNPEQSNIKPAMTLPLLGSTDGEGSEIAHQGRRELWRPLAFFALAFLTIEWMIYHRATVIRVWRGLRKPVFKGSL
jgi:Ca-activated chloride channel homolog